ncbi:MAG: triphosphoribosyl-dephospho-CoA synthase CitG [Clostridiales bacterium]|nr:triphosphoribosyl-dephospho-CoA synthase CitG [Clostridiales bacterium]
MLDEKSFIEYIAKTALQATILEVLTHPKPGLVTPFSNGSHNDMNYVTFIKSAKSIAPFLELFVKAGFNKEEDILKELRKVGLEAEKEMFKATNGINTHKGLIFILGIISAAYGNLIYTNEGISKERLSNKVKNITRGIVERELKNNNYQLTNGQKIFYKYGITGIRGEVEQGLQSIFNYALPTLKSYIKKLDLNDALVNTLLSLMAVVDDTTVVHRSDLDGLMFVKKISQEALNLDGMLTKDGRQHIEKMNQEFIKRRISPGGCADLLSATYMIYKIQNDMGE